MPRLLVHLVKAGTHSFHSPGGLAGAVADSSARRIQHCSLACLEVGDLDESCLHGTVTECPQSIADTVDRCVHSRIEDHRSCYLARHRSLDDCRTVAEVRCSFDAAERAIRTVRTVVVARQMPGSVDNSLGRILSRSHTRPVAGLGEDSVSWCC